MAALSDYLREIKPDGSVAGLTGNRQTGDKRLAAEWMTKQPTNDPKKKGRRRRYL